MKYRNNRKLKIAELEKNVQEEKEKKEVEVAEFDKGKVKLLELENRFLELEKDLIESNNLNEIMLSSLNMHLPNKSKFARKTKKTGRKSKRLLANELKSRRIRINKLLWTLLKNSHI